MAFPGRLNEKKKNSLNFYLIAVVIAVSLGLCAWQVVKAIRTPLTTEQKKEIYYDTKRTGTIGKKTNNFSSDVDQILHGNPFKHAPEKVDSGSGVRYEQTKAEEKTKVKIDKPKDKPPGDYYSDQR